MNGGQLRADAPVERKAADPHDQTPDEPGVDGAGENDGLAETGPRIARSRSVSSPASGAADVTAARTTPARSSARMRNSSTIAGSVPRRPFVRSISKKLRASGRGCRLSRKRPREESRSESRTLGWP